MGKVIRVYRHHRHHGGVSQEQMARWADTNQSHISRLENGAALNDLDRLHFWARLLGIPRHYLWFELPGDASDPHADASLAEHSTVRPDARAADSWTDQWEDPTKDPAPTLPNPPIHIDIDTAQPVRMTNYLRGGHANFAVDRDAIEYVTEALPGGVDTARTMLQMGRAFQRRVLHHLIRDVGVRQILYVGPGVPDEAKLHEAAQEVAPDTRFVYVVDDDTVMAFAMYFQTEGSEGQSAYVRGRVDDPERFLKQAADIIDFDRPVMAKLDLTMIESDDVVRHAMSQFITTLSAGSYLTVTSIASDLLSTELAAAVNRLNEMVEQSKMRRLMLRSREDLARFLQGLELVEPGIVPLDEWRPDETTPSTPDEPKPFVYGAVARKV
jgi:transcriptional regulator with XRE-family HTH domain